MNRHDDARKDAILYVVVSACILAVSTALLTALAGIVHPVGIGFAFFAAIASFIGLAINGFNLCLIYCGKQPLRIY